MESDPSQKKLIYNEKVEYLDTQLNKLVLWKNKKFREIMTAKSFIDLNKQKHT
jgi:hypothetical protein